MKGNIGQRDRYHPSAIDNSLMQQDFIEFHIYGMFSDQLQNRCCSTKSKLGRKTVLNEQPETELANYILKLSNIFYGLTSGKIKQLGFEYAFTNHIRALIG